MDNRELEELERLIIIDHESDKEKEMRLKTMDGPLSVRNGNPDILNSPKRLNTIQNSNITVNNYVTRTDNRIEISGLTRQYNNTATTDTDDNTTTGTTLTADAEVLLNNINNSEVQWCTADCELTTNNANNRLYNINSTLAVSLRNKARSGTASSICSESSPDDSLLDYEDAHQSCSSVDTSPQEEEREFDVSDTDSEEGNVNTLHSRGIVNPNYPGFQHLAHTLEYGITGASDTEDEDFDASITKLAKTQTSADDDNNNGDEITDKIDSVNRLDSVENIQKVFYDKPVFNIPCVPTGAAQSESGESSSVSNSNVISDDDSPKNPVVETPFKAEIKSEISCGNIVGNFGEEVQKEFGRIERAVERELEEAVEKLSVTPDLNPAATKYNIEPNTKESFIQPSEIETTVAMAVLADTTNFNLADDLKSIQDPLKIKLTDAFLSSVHDKIPEVKPDLFVKMEIDVAAKPINAQTPSEDSNKKLDDKATKERPKSLHEEMEKFCKEDKTKDEKEKDDDSAVPRKKEKIDFAHVKKRRDYSQQIGSLITIPRRDLSSRSRDNTNRRSLPLAREKKKQSPESLGSFDVYNIETAMPKIDLEAIESHLRAAREEERRRRTDREEIRRRLAMGNEDDYYSNYDRPGRKPSLQARLQSGMNLQICFMNDTASDTESPSSDSECTLGKPKQVKVSSKTKTPEKPSLPTRPATLSIGQQPLSFSSATTNETDFFTKQARLQTEARMALAQAKEMARMQMEIERQRQKKSPITEMVRHSMEKVGIPFPEDRRRLSRQILTEMNVAQLQVIVNDLHTQIEILNENLVKFLMDRDDLHMEQDSMLVDIEDLTRFLGAKEQTLREHNGTGGQNNNMPPPSPAPSSPLAALNSSVKPHLHRIASFVKK